ncbi:MAG: hypothetical protein JNM57_04270 [Cyclobacteriaceae bacterium]|nr:hypothetical protein [Cyclobacteriaceae bacterium]
MSDRWLAFYPIFSPAVIVVVVVLVTIAFAWMEWSRKLRFRIWRIVSLMVVMLSLSGLIFRPAVPRKKNSSAIVLLTSNYRTQTVDSLVRLFPELTILQAPESEKYNKGEYLPSFHSLTALQGNIRFVVGDGLPLHALDLLNEKEFDYIPGHPHEGISELTLPPVMVNALTTIQGTYTNHRKFSTITLRSPAGDEDAVQVSPGINHSFELLFTPKQVGNFLYHVQLKDSSGSIVEENPLPISITEAKKLNILFLQHFPTAEVRYLKNFLAEQNHAIAVRYQLSKGTYRYEFANSSPRLTDKINTALLAAFDLVILDTDVFQSLSVSEKNSLKESIDQGLGAIVLFHDLPSKINGLKSFLPVSFTKVKQDTVAVHIRGYTHVFPVTSETILPNRSVQSVVDSKGRILAGYIHHGFGKIGFQVLQETYPLIIQGKKDSYAMLWAPMLTQIARNEKVPFQLNVITEGPLYTNEPVDIEILSSGNQPFLFADSVRIPLAEDVLLDDRWSGRAWFENAGWHSFQFSGDSTLHHVYIFNPGEWESWRANVQTKMNRLSHPHHRDKEMETVLDYRPISAWYFFILLVCAAGFLWLAPKL